MQIRIVKAATNINAAWHNSRRHTQIPPHRDVKCKGNGWEMRTMDGDLVQWYPTKKAAVSMANAIGAKIVK